MDMSIYPCLCYCNGMTVKLSPIDTKILKGKLEGKKQVEIAREVFPNNTQQSGEVLVSKALRKINLQAALEAALIRNGITIDKALKPIEKALNAKNREIIHRRTETGSGKTREVIIEDEIVETDNLPLQLQASDRARELMGIGKSNAINDDNANLSQEEIEALAMTSDEVELTRVIFKRARE